jgi:uncharacterized membrane protein YgaE (UPF0421/DUF939 family)
MNPKEKLKARRERMTKKDLEKWQLLTSAGNKIIKFRNLEFHDTYESKLYKNITNVLDDLVELEAAFLLGIGYYDPLEGE